MILRIQTAEQGTKRVEVNENDSCAALYEKAISLFQLQSPRMYKMYKSRDQKQAIEPAMVSIKSCNLKHGDMLYLFKLGENQPGVIRKGEGVLNLRPPEPAEDSSSTDGTSNASFASANASSETSYFSSNAVLEDSVDVFLHQQDGRIARPMNEQFCRHSKSNKCVHCLPLDPWDETYLKERDPPIKFLSFHAHIRKLKSGADKGKFVFLDDINCQILPGCTSCAGWPIAVCTKCQPSAVVLNRQTYRHVDYVAFQNPTIIQNFLDFWRSSGFQRAAYMYGRYEHHQEVPLGIKAVVYCLYEPPQNCSANSIEFLDDPHEQIVEELAKALGLVRVGWIFTDLLTEDSSKGTVKYTRGPQSYFLSAEEVITASYLQTKHPNPCKIATNGAFGSKFVTVCATGNVENQIHFEAYQISNQGMALVRDKCLVPTHDRPELAYVKESSPQQYVPDVFYKQKDEFGNEKTELGRPLPIEYLLIDLPSGFPVEEICFFNKHAKQAFPSCNRELVGQSQDFPALTKYFDQFGPDDFYRAVCDFQLLIALAKLDVYPLMPHLGGLLKAIKEQNKEAVEAWAREEHWQTVHQLMEAHGPSESMAIDGTPMQNGDTWACQHCTFHNATHNNSCDMCGLPRN